MTDFINKDPKTFETSKTDLTDNQNFLVAVFGHNLNEAYPIIVSFKGNPNTAAGKNWFGHPWGMNNLSSVLDANTNNYFSLATFRPDKEEQYRRKKAQFHSLHCILLDDVGSKVKLDRLTLQPSWLLETSPGNFQAGYILDVPITNKKIAEQLVNAIIAAGLCDPGANGPTARLARLPVAVNGKHEPPFPCKLITWAPEKRYSVQELINGLQLEIVEIDRSKRHGNQTERTEDTESDQIWTPRPEENTVLAALSRHNIYKLPLGEGKHDVTCPWVNEHTGGIDNGSAYFEPDDNYPIGGFKCLHGHCANRHIRDLLRILDVDIKSARMKPSIRVVKGEIHRIIDAAECELAGTSQYYQRGGLIVSVYSDPSTSETRIQEVSQPSLVRALAKVATWEQFDKRSNAWERTDPPARHTAILFDANVYNHLPPLKGLSRQPYLRVDGSLVTTAGYDPATGLFGVFDNRKFLIPDTPSLNDAKSALRLLNDLLNEFSFTSETDRAAALTAFITAAIRPILPHAPMIHVQAHTVGSGKSYLCKLITVFATPQQGTPTTFPADDEECRKLLLAELLRAPAVIEFDNLTNDILPHKSLCTALTSEYISGRILGVSKTATVNTRVLFISSGNNVGPIKDMARRCIIINLNPEVEIPAVIIYKRPNLISEVLQERERYVSAALTIVRAWIIAGKPKMECKSLAGYGEWSDLCRQPLLWLGCPDPTLSIFEALSNDPERELMTRLLMAWKSEFGKIPAMVREAVKQSDANFELREVLNDIAYEKGEINRRKLGWWIKNHTGQIVDGLRFIRCSSNKSVEKWKVESVSQVLQVSNGQKEKNVCTEEEYLQATRDE